METQRYCWWFGVWVVPWNVSETQRKKKKKLGKEVEEEEEMPDLWSGVEDVVIGIAIAQQEH